MNILVVGGGGREHALVWKLAQSWMQPSLFAAPGNAGTAELAENLDVDPDDIDRLLACAEEHDVDLTIVGPELSLVLGIVDRFRKAGRAIVGPTAAAAQLEGSKDFAKAFMERHGVPTASYRTFTAEDDRVRIDYGERAVTIELGPQKHRSIGSLRLPYIEVRFTFLGFSTSERRHFMERFELFFQRGGG